MGRHGVWLTAVIAVRDRNGGQAIDAADVRAIREALGSSMGKGALVGAPFPARGATSAARATQPRQRASRSRLSSRGTRRACDSRSHSEEETWRVDREKVPIVWRKDSRLQRRVIRLALCDNRIGEAEQDLLGRHVVGDFVLGFGNPVRTGPWS